jgi:membrane protein implicated in regulation of membrane protease activity
MKHENEMRFMSYRAGNHWKNFRSADFFFYGMWTFLVVVGLIVYATPFFLIAALFALAVGFSPGTALTVFPIAFIVMLFLACVVASRLTRWPAARSTTTRSDPSVRTGSRFVLPDKTASPSDYYRDVKRLHYH